MLIALCLKLYLKCKMMHICALLYASEIVLISMITLWDGCQNTGLSKESLKGNCAPLPVLLHCIATSKLELKIHFFSVLYQLFQLVKVTSKQIIFLNEVKLYRHRWLNCLRRESDRSGISETGSANKSRVHFFQHSILRLQFHERFNSFAALCCSQLLVSALSVVLDGMFVKLMHKQY